MMRRKAYLGVLASLGLLAAAAAQGPPVTFHVQPDDNGGPGSDSMVSGQLGGPPQAVGFDLTAFLSDDRGGWFTLEPDPVAPDQFTLIDLFLSGRDAASGATLVLELQGGQTGSVTTSDPNGGFPVGAQMSLSAPVSIQVTGGPPGVPSQGSLSLTGTFAPGFNHQAALLQGTLDTLPGVSVSVQVKQDFYVPGITWILVADPASSWILPTGGSQEPLAGHLELVRDVVDPSNYVVGTVSFTASGGSILGDGPGPDGGTLDLDAVSRNLNGSISWALDGSPFNRTLDTVQDQFEGAATRPRRVVIHENGPGLAGLDELHLELHRVALVRAGSVPVQGQTYQPRLWGPPGWTYAYVGAADPAPGINTPVGDVAAEPDWLFFITIQPGNPLLPEIIGPVPADGSKDFAIPLPQDPALDGFTFFLAGLVIDPSSGQLAAVTNSHRVIL